MELKTNMKEREFGVYLKKEGGKGVIYDVGMMYFR